MERQLATIRKITGIEEIPGADNIQLARIDGWQSVIKRDEFKVGETVCFIEIDSVMPVTEWSKFLADKNDPTKPIRLKTVRLRGVISQGLIIKHSYAFRALYKHIKGIPPQFRSGCIAELRSDESYIDVTEVLGIVKYEPAVAPHLAGKTKGNFPIHLFPKTDSSRIQNLWKDKFLDEIHGVRFVARFKEDGTSSSSFFHNDDVGVCSRNLQLKTDDATNTYVRMFYEQGINHLFERLKKNIALQYEIVGPGIQKNRSNIAKTSIRVFDVYNIDKKEYMSFDDLWTFCSVNYLPQVTTLTDNFVFDKNVHTLDYLISMTEQVYDGTNQQIEGLVFTPYEERFSKVLNGRMRFKVINPNYLLKND